MKFLLHNKHNGCPLERKLRILLFSEISVVCCENHMQQINRKCGHTEEF